MWGEVWRYRKNFVTRANGNHPLGSGPITCSTTIVIVPFFPPTWLIELLKPAAEWPTPEHSNWSPLMGGGDSTCQYSMTTVHLYKYVTARSMQTSTSMYHTYTLEFSSIHKNVLPGHLLSKQPTRLIAPDVLSATNKGWQLRTFWSTSISLEWPAAKTPAEAPVRKREKRTTTDAPWIMDVSDTYGGICRNPVCSPISPGWYAAASTCYIRIYFVGCWGIGKWSNQQTTIQP